jgi:ABC-2 type transport system permease protein
VTRWSAELIDQIACLDLVDDLPLAYAVIALAVVLGGGTWLTGWQLRSFNLTGDE